jgi:hypothetical protein
MTNLPETEEERAERELAEIEYYKANEEQDNLLERGIKLLSTKVLDLIILAQKNGLNVDSETDYTSLTHKKWSNSIMSVYDELHAWEVEHVGEEQFTKCFHGFINGLRHTNNNQYSSVALLPQFSDRNGNNRNGSNGSNDHNRFGNNDGNNGKKNNGQNPGGSLAYSKDYDVNAKNP